MVERESADLNKRKTQNKSEKFDAKLYEIITTEYKKLDKKKRNVDELYTVLQKKDLLSDLNKADLSVYFDQIAEKGFSLKELSDSRIQKIDKRLGSGLSEESIINNSLQEIQKLSQEDSSLFDNFASEMNFSRRGKKTVVSEKSSCTSVTALQQEWARYCESKKKKGPIVNNISRYLQQIGVPGSKTDLTNKRVTQAAIRKIAANLPTKALRSAWTQRVVVPIDAFSSVQNLSDLQQALSSFLHDNQASFKKEQRERFQGMIVSNKNILQEVRANTTIEGNIEDSHEQRAESFQVMFNNLVTAQSVEKIYGAQEQVRRQASGVSTMLQGITPKASAVGDTYPPTGLEKVDSSLADVAKQKSEQKPNSKPALIDESQNTALKRKKRLAYTQKIAQSDRELSELLHKASTPTGFDFSRLSSSELSYYFQSQVYSQLKPLLENGIHHTLGLEEGAFVQYMMDIYDTDTKQITIPTAEGDIFLEFSFKGVQPGSLLTEEELSPARFANREGGKCHLGIKITEENEEFLRDVVSPTSYLDFNGTPVHEGEYVKLVGPNGEEVEGYLTMTEDSPEIDEQSGKRTNKKLHNSPGFWALSDTPVTTAATQRNLIMDPRDPTQPRLINATHNDPRKPQQISGEGEWKIYDKDYDKSNLRLTGDQLSGLTSAYMLGQQSLSANRLAREDIQELAALDEKLQPQDKFRDTYEENPSELEDTDSTEGQKESSEKYFDNFLKAWKEIPGSTDRNESNKYGFVPGSILYLTDESADGLPWSRGATYAFQITEISPATGEWTVKMHGTKQTAGEYEGKKQTLSLSPESIATLRKHFSGPMAVSTNTEKDDIERSFQALHDAQLVQDQPTAFSKAVWGSEGREDKSQKKKFPYYTDGKHVLSMKPAGGDTVAVESTWLEDHGGDDEKKRKSRAGYKKVVDYPTLWLMLDGKDWQPMDEEDYNQKILGEEKEVTKLEDIGTKRQMFSLNNIITGAKNVFSTIGDKMKEFDKERTDDFVLSATRNGSFLRSIAGGFGAIGIGGVEEGMEMAHLDLYGNKSKKTFAKISKRKDSFGQHDDTGEIVNDVVEPYLNSEEAPAKRPYKAAGALLFMLEKAGGPYARNLTKYAGTGYWTKMLLGEAAQKQLLEQTAEIIKKLEKDPGNMNLMKEYADKEMNFIQVTIDGDFQGLKDFYGVTFADTVAELKDKMYGEDSIGGKFNMYVGSRDFNWVSVEFHSNIKKFIMDKSIGALKAMVELADSPARKLEVQEAFTLAMVSGIFLNVTNYTTKEEIEKLAVRIGFMPGARVKQFDQQEKIAGLFDFITDGGFSQQTGFTKSEYGSNNYGKNLTGDDNKISKFRAWRSASGKDVMSFLELANMNSEPERSLVALANDTTGEKVGPAGNKPNKYEQNLLKDVVTNLTSERMTSFDTKAEAGIFTTAPFTIPATVVENQFGKYRQYKYSGAQNEDMLRVIQSFWVSLKDQTPQKPVPRDVLIFITKKFLGFFPHLRDGEEAILVEVMGTIKKQLANEGSQGAQKAKSLLDVGTVGFIKGRGMPEEMRKALEGFRDMLINNISEIDRNFVEQIFDGDEEKLHKFENVGPYMDHQEYERIQRNKRDPKYILNQKLSRKDQNLRNRSGATLFNEEFMDTEEEQEKKLKPKQQGIKISSDKQKLLEQRKKQLKEGYEDPRNAPKKDTSSQEELADTLESDLGYGGFGPYGGGFDQGLLPPF